MRVLLVEDHLQLAESVAQALKSTGLTVDVLHDGVAADLALSSEEYAAVILDVGLPRLDGFEVLARLRARGKNLPVLMLTARSDVKDRVHGLNLGADDYLAKPFELTELEARVKALLRRSVLGGERQQTCGVLVYDLDTRRFTVGGELMTLTSREQAVLEALIARPPQVDIKSTVGAGDAMVAGMVAGFCQGLSLGECASLGTAFSLSAITNFVRDLPPKDVLEQWQAQVVIQPLL